MLDKYLADTGFDFADLRKSMEDIIGDQVKAPASLLQAYRLLVDLHGANLHFNQISSQSARICFAFFIFEAYEL